LRFFERAEIKDALAYLRIIANPKDDASFERIINVPTRGIGAKSLDLIRDLARREQFSLWESLERLCLEEALPSRTRNPFIQFRALIEHLTKVTVELMLWEKTQKTLTDSGLLEHYRKERSEQAEQRVENLEELVNAARQFEHEPTLDPELPVLEQFLAHAALESGENQANADNDCVRLMTLHAAKGLEFDLVFLVGLEEGLFPSLQSLDEVGRLEEERRLCYVGITRARKKLYLTYAESRRLYGKETYPRPSRFLREIPPENIEEVRLRGGNNKASTMDNRAPLSQAKNPPFRVGQRVVHGKFGEGVILQTEGEGAQTRIHVNFSDCGMKWLMLAYANLEYIH
jgi:DNA helicase-2/ATP-dependent DNA helicase PcrA